MKCLFIGGPADGTMREVHRDHTYYRVAEPPRRPIVALRSEQMAYGVTRQFTYRRERLCDGHGNYDVFVVEGHGSLLESLINGYKQGT